MHARRSGRSRRNAARAHAGALAIIPFLSYLVPFSHPAGRNSNSGATHLRRPTTAEVRAEGDRAIAVTEMALSGAGFAAVLSAMLAWEHSGTLRHGVPRNGRRRMANLALGALGYLSIRLVAPASLATTAYAAERHGIGLFNLLSVPAVVAWAASVIFLDLCLYFQHRLLHRVPVLWRLHAVHHADLGFDVTTGVRFHPLEILLSFGWKSLAVIALGAPAGAAALFELVLSSASLFTHGNVQLPARLERVVRWLTITPTIHRIHHSITPAERESNYGFNLSIWDRLFGTYRDSARAPDVDLVVGLRGVAAARVGSLAAMLTFPVQGFRSAGTT